MTLPEHRRIVHGRTWSSAYDPSDFDPGPYPHERAWGIAELIALAILVCIVSWLILEALQ